MAATGIRILAGLLIIAATFEALWWGWTWFSWTIFSHNVSRAEYFNGSLQAQMLIGVILLSILAVLATIGALVLLWGDL